MFVTATNVRTGRGHVFRNADLTPDVLLASACLPTMFQAVEIDGEAYWDGGYSGNPSMAPLIRECHASDTILVQINPIERPGTPRSAREIHNRLNEIAFNSVLLKEMRTARCCARSPTPATGEGAIWAHMRVHRIASDVMLDLGYSSKLIAEWSFFCMLRDEGRKAASAFLDAHAKDLGVRSTFDLDADAAKADRDAIDGPRRHPRGSRGSRLVLVPRLERARARADRGARRRARRERAAARELDHHVHGRGGGLHPAVLPAVPAGRGVRQADGGLRLGRRDRRAG